MTNQVKGIGKQLCEILHVSRYITWQTLAVRDYGLDTDFGCDLGDITFGLGHDRHILVLWATILSRSNMALAVRSYGPDTDFGYVCTVTLILEVHPWVMDNNYVKYYPDWTRR